MNKKILVLKGQSQYNVLRIATDYMISAFEKEGYIVTTIDLLVKEDRERFNSELDNGHGMLFSFQALLFNECIENTKNSIFRYKNIMVFGHIVDHPIWHSSRLESQHGDSMYIGSIDRNHVDYINKYYKGVKNVFYLPHGGFKAKNIVPYEQRTIDVFFPSSYTSSNEIRNGIKELPEVYQGIAEILIKNMLYAPMLTLQDALEQYLSSIKFTYSEEEFTTLMIILQKVDNYVRSYTREKLIYSLLSEGVTITVSGKGWDNFELSDSPNFIIKGENGLDFLEILEVMGNSKMVLNHVPTLQNGMHERIYSSMRCGAICITNDFPIIQEEFTNNENIIAYTLDHIHVLAGTIKELLREPDKAKLISDRGYSIAEGSHKWEDNAMIILDTYRKCCEEV